MIPQEEDQDTDPLTLLPSVLQHLPNLLDNPSLASSVFRAVRKVSHNSKAHVFITPLLAPITAAALTASSTQLRLDAANTCAALVRALIHRRAISAAIAYIHDLVQLAHQIAEYYGPDPPKCILHRFTKISATIPISSPVVEKLKHFNISVQHLSLTSDSLEGVLQLFASLIPSQHQLPTQLFCRHVKSTVEPISPQSASTSHHLWIGIGSRARAAIYSLAASRPVLSMSCGIRVALMAASVLERSFDPSCGCLVPVPTAQSLIAKVETILIETSCFPPSGKLHVDVRLTLYKLALLASSSGSLTSSLWGTCGIIEAATNIEELGNMLRSLSRNGRVAYHQPNSSFDLKQILNGLVPPSKRRRINSQKHVPVFDEGDSATPSSQNQHSSVESYEPQTQQMNGPVAALQQCLADAGNIYLFTTNPELMKMFAHTFLLTADTFKSMTRENSINVTELEKWISFVLSISKMVNDLTPSLSVSASTDSWKATFELAFACSDLYVALEKIDSVHHTDEKVAKAIQSASLPQIRSYLLTSISSVIALAYDAGKASHEDLPIKALSDLLWYIGELALTSECLFSDSQGLRKTCEDLQKAALQKLITSDIKSCVLLFRSSTHAYLSCNRNGSSDAYNSQISEMKQLFSETDNDELLSAVMQGMADSICIEACCHNKHFRSMRETDLRSQHSERTTSELVHELFLLVSPIVETDCSTTTRGQAINCLGVISLHGSKELAEQCGTIFVKAIWHVDYQNRLKAHLCLTELLTYRGEEISLKSETSSFETDGQVLPLDDPWECFRDLMKPSEGNLALSKLAQALHVELVSNYDRVISKGSSRWTPNMVDRDNSFSCALITILFIDGLVPLALGAFAFGQLLLSAVEDLDYVSSKDESECADDEAATDETSISLPALDRLLTTIKHLTTSRRSTTKNFNFPNEDTSFEKIRFSSSINNSSNDTNNPFPTSIGTFVLLHMHDWLPFLLESILKKPSLANHLACLITNGDVPLFWMKVARLSVGPTLCYGDVSTINDLSQQANFEVHGLVEKIWPDVLARALMMDPAFVATKHGVGYTFLTDTLRQPLETIVATRCGKVVQRLVMELAGKKAHCAERALNSIGKIIAHSSDGYSTSENFGGELLSTHFMLVMDAVNRGLFHSRATAKEKIRHLRILRRVVVLASQKLHLFIPKVLATLRLSLDSMKEKDVKQEIMIVWVAFLKTLGPKNCRSQLASVLAILVPILHDYESILEEPLRSMIEYVSESQYGDEEEIMVLLRVGRSHICQDLAHMVENTIFECMDVADILRIRRINEQRPGFDFFSICEITCKVVSKHSNGSIEILTTKYLLELLQKNRKQVEILRSEAILGDGQETGRNKIALLLRDIVELINKNRNTDCRITLMQCIGEVGSFHPSFVLSHQQKGDQKNNKVIDKARREYPANKYAISAFLLDVHLVPILVHGEKHHVASTHVNRIGLVIQELLRACGCSKNTVSRAGLSKHSSDEPTTIDWRTINLQETVDGKALYFWERLQSSTQEAIFPYLSEPFDVRLYSGVFGGDIAGDSNAACDRVWQKVKETSGSPHAPSAMEWIRQIVVQLVDFIGKRGPFGKVFRALRPLLRYEAAVAEFVLPLVIRTALDLQYMEEKDDISQFVCTELSEVFQEASSVQPVFDLLDVLRHWRETDCYLIGRRSALERLGIAPGSGVSDNPRGNWSNAQAESFKKRDPLSCLVDLDGVVDKKLSILTLSKSAFRARSFHRAVMFAEQHIRNLRRERNNGGWPSYIENLVGKICSGQDGNADEELEALGVLQQAFAQLEKSDSMGGVATLRANSTVEESILDEEAAGRFDSALTTYERAISRSPRNEDFHRGFLGCLMTLGHWETMLSHSEGLLASVQIAEDKLRLTAETHGIEAAWRLGRWEKLEELTDQSLGNDRYRSDEKSGISWMADFNVSFGKMLLSMRARDSSAVDLAAYEARRHLEIPLARAAREGYARAYPLITLLHSISDIEDVANMLKKSPVISVEEDTAQADGNALDLTLIMLRGRETVVSKSMRIRERILSTKRLCFEYLNMPNEAAKSSLQLAGLASESDNLRAASASAFRALSTRNVGEVVSHACAMEMAKICWKQGDSTGALGMIKKEIDRLRSNLPKIDRRRKSNVPTTNEASDRLCTAYVVAAEWMEETRGEPSDVILHYLDNAAEFGPHREEPFYALGRHYDSLLQANLNTDSKFAPTADLTSARPSRRNHASSSATGLQQDHTKYVPLVIKSFSKALCNGHSRIYEAVPRMLTVWFDFYTLVTDPNYSGDGLALEEEVKNEMKRAFETVPLYMWAAAVPQLMSRLLHSHKSVREELNHLLARIVCEFTDYSVWTILPSSQLRTMERKRAASDVLNYSIQLQRKSKSSDAKESSRALRSRIQKALIVVQHLVDICLTTPSKDRRGRKDNFANEFKDLRTHLRGSTNLNPIMPTLDSLTVRLPTGNESSHIPFSTRPIRISNIDNIAMVMPSLMRPRRISLVGSDGIYYKYLAKKEAHGDMRKDSRLVEFITVVNRLISKDSTTRGRNLELKTYSVLPLSEETGLIEWVDDVTPLRSIVKEEHEHVSNIPSVNMIQSKYQSVDHRRFLEGWAFPKHPVVLDRFFMKEFGGGADAQRWLESRDLWTQSTAVWSMAGYVIGLGDRHGENILIETTTGRCVHVDFAMLFDKGLKLKFPEIVPFRLTRNMVTAMGIAGYEGEYRKCCERVMELMRMNLNTLLGVLESFLHDPMADWTRGDINSSRGGWNRSTNKEALQARMVVKAKLTGLVDNSGLPLSIHGQVQRLIYEATNIDNLSEMFLWWSAWI